MSTSPLPESDLAPWHEMTPEDVWEELRRACASEARLANVLEAHYNRLTTNYQSAPGAHEIVISNHELEKMREALRLAGRNA